MKLEPVDFYQKVEKEELCLIDISVNIDLNTDMEGLFDDTFRAINAKDPSFCYSCRCNQYYFYWSFAYKNEDCFVAAQKHIQEYINKCVANRENTMTSTQETIEDLLLRPGIHDGCACPFKKDVKN